MKNEVKKLMTKFDEGPYDRFTKKIMKSLGFFLFVVVVGIKRMVTNDIFMGKTHYFFQ